MIHIRSLIISVFLLLAVPLCIGSAYAQHYTANKSQKTVTNAVTVHTADNKKTADTDKDHYAIWTVGIGIATAVILFFQLFVFGLQAHRLRQTIDEMKRATQASKDVAEAATEQLAIARKEFISTHRPRPIVRMVTIKPYTDPSVPLEPGKPIQIEWSVVNVGDTPCEIVEGNATILVSHDFKPRTPYSASRDDMKGTSLLPGETYTFTLIDDEVHLKNDPQVFDIDKGNKRIYFFGFIMYKDDIGTVRRTAFLRLYNPAFHWFDISKYPDYEYQD